MPYYHGPQVTSPTPNAFDTTKVTYFQTLFSLIVDNNWEEQGHLSHIPVQFGKFLAVTPCSAHSSANDKLPCLALEVLFFNWAVNLFGGGHFILTIRLHNLPFSITLACDQV
jgi:hypothetical protein